MKLLKEVDVATGAHTSVQVCAVSCLSNLIKETREDHPELVKKKIVVLLDRITEEEITFRHTILVCSGPNGFPLLYQLNLKYMFIQEAAHGGFELDFVCMTEQQRPEGIDRFRKAISGHRHCTVRQVSFGKQVGRQRFQFSCTLQSDGDK